MKRSGKDDVRNETALPLAWEAEADRQPSDAYGRGRADALRDAAAALRLRRRCLRRLRRSDVRYGGRRLLAEGGGMKDGTALPLVDELGPVEVVVNDVRYVREATLFAAMERADELKMALAEVCDVAIWMSGADAFGPSGEAAEGWPSQRDRLHKALAVLHG